MIKIAPFDDSLEKDRRRASENQSTNTNNLDAYRQGVELTTEKHYAQGMVKIHSGFNGQSGGHEIPQHTLGLGRSRPRDENSFLDGIKLDPLSRFDQYVAPPNFTDVFPDIANLWVNYSENVYIDSVGGWNLNATFGGSGDFPPVATINDHNYPVFDGGYTTSGLTRSGNYTTLDGLADWTIFAALKTNNSQAYGGILDKGSAFYIELSFGSGAPYIGVGAGGGADISCTIGVDDDEWHNLIVTCNSGTVTVYVDGTLDGTDTGGTIPTVVNDVILGCQPSNSTTDSGIAIVGVMTVGLSTTQIATLKDMLTAWVA